MLAGQVRHRVPLALCSISGEPHAAAEVHHSSRQLWGGKLQPPPASAGKGGEEGPAWGELEGSALATPSCNPITGEVTGTPAAKPRQKDGLSQNVCSDVAVESALVLWFNLAAGNWAPDSRSLTRPRPCSGMGRRNEQKGKLVG